MVAALVQMRSWDRALRNVERAQERTLARLLSHACHTEFGRAHGFDRIRDYADFARRVPVGDYDSFSPHIDRMRAGERNVLVPGARSLLRQLVGQLEPGQAEVPAHHGSSDPASAARRDRRGDALPSQVARRRPLLGLHPGPLSSDDHEGRRADARDVEPGAHGDEDALAHPSRLPARSRRANHRQLREEARRHRRAVPRFRRQGCRRDDVLVHAPVREGARGGEGSRARRPERRCDLAQPSCAVRRRRRRRAVPACDPPARRA